MIPVVFRPAAAADLDEVYCWYESGRPALGEDFLAAVQTAIELIGSNPLAYPEVHRGRRRALLRRFPYGLFYRVLASEA